MSRLSLSSALERSRSFAIYRIDNTYSVNRPLPFLVRSRKNVISAMIAVPIVLKIKADKKSVAFSADHLSSTIPKEYHRRTLRQTTEISMFHVLSGVSDSDWDSSSRVVRGRGASNLSSLVPFNTKLFVSAISMGPTSRPRRISMKIG
jgi:hypothetical protein